MRSRNARPRSKRRKSRARGAFLRRKRGPRPDRPDRCNGGELATRLRRLCARNPRAVTRNCEACDIARSVCVQHRDKAELRIAPAMGNAGRHREIDVWHHALVQQQRVDVHALVPFAEPAIRHRFEPAVAPCASALRLERDDVADHRELATHRKHEAQAVCEIGRGHKACAMAERLPQVGVRRRVENGLEPHAGIEILPGEQPEQRPASRKHRAALRHQARGLEEDLRAACRHHARQRPARDRKRTLDRAGRKDDAPGFDQARAGSDGDRDLAFPQQAPHICAGHMMRAACERLAHERAAAPVVVARTVPRRERRRGHGALNLPAGMRLLVEEDGVEPGARAQARAASPPVRRPTTATS